MYCLYPYMIGSKKKSYVPITKNPIAQKTNVFGLVEGLVGNVSKWRYCPKAKEKYLKKG